eukprot:TRINITY_DN68057_c1_g1_i2.p1 TRINITY_DN68057_c1_g1~~TRINITY_DN68057_c1_g1_i2.p1  ORF type:complete len:310 (-),score=39.20 TRINITY_DN68057_c1_g1_i2:184-1113(-)
MGPMIFSEEWKQTSEAFSTFLSSLDNIRHSVQQKQTEFDEHCAALNKKIEETHKQSTEHKIVKLNIGGQKFQTSQDTLLNVHENFFWCMLHSGDWKPDEEHGEYFIDRSPTAFPLILESLRQQKPVSTEHLSKFEEDMLNNDLDFYGLSQFWGKVVATGGGPRSAIPVAWCPRTSTGGGFRFTNNYQTAVFEPGQFVAGTQVMTPPLNPLLSNETTLRIECTEGNPSQFLLVITDATGKIADSLQFRTGPLNNPSPIEFTATNEGLRCCRGYIVRWIDLTRHGITDPVCAVQFVGDYLAFRAEFRIATL